MNTQERTVEIISQLPNNTPELTLEDCLRLELQLQLDRTTRLITAMLATIEAKQ
jgi:hypothetical protein